MILPTESFENIDGFNESIFMYFDENEFYMCTVASRYRFAVIQADVFHGHHRDQFKVLTIGSWLALKRLVFGRAKA